MQSKRQEKSSRRRILISKTLRRLLHRLESVLLFSMSFQTTESRTIHLSGIKFLTLMEKLDLMFSTLTQDVQAFFAKLERTS